MHPEDGDTSAPQTPVAPVTDEPIDYSSPNDIDYELSEEQEQAFVDQILNDGDYKAPVAEVVEPVVDTPEPVVTPPVVDAPVAPVTPVVDAPVETAAPQTDDLWIEVDSIVTDSEGTQTVEKVKMAYDPEDPASFIPDDFNFKNDKQLADILEAKAEMAQLYKSRTSEYNEALETAQSVKDIETKQAEQLSVWEQEVQDLIAAGVLAKPGVEPGDPTFIDDPSIQKIDAVFKYMVEQNTARSKDGKSAIHSFGTAFAMYENSEAVKAAKVAEQQEIVDTKQKGGMVGGGSASSGGAPQKGAYIAGSAKNIWDIEIPG